MSPQNPEVWFLGSSTVSYLGCYTGVKVEAKKDCKLWETKLIGVAPSTMNDAVSVLVVGLRSLIIIHIDVCFVK